MRRQMDNVDKISIYLFTHINAATETESTD
jgi:hypothetical protein